MGKIEFIKINGKDVAVIDEFSPIFEDILTGMALRAPISLRCGSEVSVGQYVSPNERGEIIPSDGSNICGIVVEVIGNNALISLY